MSSENFDTFNFDFIESILIPIFFKGSIFVKLRKFVMFCHKVHKLIINYYLICFPLWCLHELSRRGLKHSPSNLSGLHIITLITDNHSSGRSTCVYGEKIRRLTYTFSYITQSHRDIYIIFAITHKAKEIFLSFPSQMTDDFVSYTMHAYC